MKSLDHPIFTESIRRIREQLGVTGLDPLQQQVLERLIHSSGDFGLTPLLRFTPEACELGLAALQAGAPILTDTAMAAVAVQPMARRTLKTSVRCVLEWAPDEAPNGSTRTAEGLRSAWQELAAKDADQQAPIVLIGSAPTALEALLDLVSTGAPPPSLIIGMPVGFVGVSDSKWRLAVSGLAHIRLMGSRGGAGLVAATVNALLRRAWLDQ
ncbi:MULTISPECIES: precorrin-8X methylmutase [Prochlorococcus]|uniref:precorrin-8X methylmutase n=1 Tax=Prochlorococcus TaxID=1218 RepID=UPI0007B3A457|nr:precorrin-8X methylmutase [Prochlorococcus marinus]MEC7737884.1 precorrin-8X methylmutase [Cyanobacteriota bacterium]NMO84295.1 precorrin-8X methylmutase [Prochlorococcus sp. P1344]NMP07379.1 precorrin-8X methylmutase [Prochlorococcus sp. P1361]NMP14720.1 precorrin-8X methylmutase [Prochlorococcus sp.P1363]KZR64896.1 Precorrin-8X methylmutase [Prochlorococcus marinus str. MIT 1312]